MDKVDRKINQDNILILAVFIMVFITMGIFAIVAFGVLWGVLYLLFGTGFSIFLAKLVNAELNKEL